MNNSPNIINEETGDPAVSYANVLNLLDCYGKLIGVIHSIIPFEIVNEETKETEFIKKHVTRFFFSKGYTHTCFGFILGLETDKRKDQKEYSKLFALSMLLNMIPGLYPYLGLGEEKLANLGFDIEGMKLFDEQKAVYYLFVVPEHARSGNILHSPGFTSIMNALDILEEEGETVRKIGED